MNYLDLFSGIGGFPLGAYRAGWRFDRHYFSEVDEYAIKVYRQRFPDAMPLGDITKIDGNVLANAGYAESQGRNQGSGCSEAGPQPGNKVGDELASCGSQAWIITGGFPCQDISVAGKGEGIGGSRSGLWFEMWRLIRDIRPRFVIAENVGAITFRGLDRVLSSLAEIGFDAEWQDIRASDVGAAHRRERIWIVAYPESDGRREASIRRQEPSRATGASAMADTEGDNKRRTREAQRRQQSETGRRGTQSGEIPDANGEQAGRPTESRRERCAGATQQQLGLLADGLSPWLVEPDIPRVSRGERHRVDKLKCLGNSIVPQIAQLIFEQIGDPSLTALPKAIGVPGKPGVAGRPGRHE